MSDLATDVASHVRALVQLLRNQPAGESRTLVDALMSSELPREAWQQFLLDYAGIDVCTQGEALTPRFEQWGIELAQRYRCALVEGADGALKLALEEPFDEGLIGRVSQKLGYGPALLAVPRAAIDAWLLRGEKTLQIQDDTVQPTETGPVVGFVDRSLRSGFEAGASDVHFECDRTGMTVKHRLDGVLVTFDRLDGVRSAQEAISRIKVLALLDITERRLPQDGRFRMAMAGQELDLRVSIMPSVNGEDAVLRLLDKAQLRGKRDAVTLDLLGFDEQSAARIRELAHMPSGMLLVTGPTGSGKTTTVYAVLSEINTGIEKIITIEDPVEYELTGVLQIPVNERKGLTFAKGLRSILRHDPDRILVGEVRDGETAEIAVQSALTGHLVFTTVHANSISDVVGRFRHFGLDMFGFMSALNGVVVQRLLRRLCFACRMPRALLSVEQQWLARMGVECPMTLMSANGCVNCHQSGYAGRFVLAEVHAVDDELRDSVSSNAPLSTLKAHATRNGVKSLASQAAALVVHGETTFEEVRRVVGLA